MKRTPIRRVSVKRAAQLRQYSSQRTTYLKAHPICHVCRTEYSTEIHHKQGRIGLALLDEAHWIAICRQCHRRVEENKSWARAEGHITY
jgi:hypothetical protein